MQLTQLRLRHVHTHPEPIELNKCSDRGAWIDQIAGSQLKHFNELEKSLLKAGKKLTDLSRIKTELHASKYLKKMTALLHPQGVEKPQKTVRRKKVRKAAKVRAKSKQVKRRIRA